MTVFDLAAKISLDTSGYEQGLSSARGQAQSFAGELKSAFGSLINMGAVAVGVEKTAEAVIGGVKQSVTEFANTQQLIGGVETLYKDSADIIKAYADGAYQTAGMSANDYMETATSFAARLIDGLGGDTEAAAQLVDTAITDMSDNANKFGTDMSAVQNAYQGFAKQNYSMLDNLKLGFGGTQQEMYRLLQTAQELEPAFDAVFSMDAKGHLTAEFSDIIEAIHIVQENLGVTGTAAQEASSTISGSFASAKAALDNFMSGLANPEADVGALFDQFVEAAKTAKDNVVPAVEEIFSNIGELAAELGPELGEKAKDAVNQLIEGFQSGDIQAVVSEKLQTVSDTAQEILGTLFDAMPEQVQGLIQSIGGFFDSLWSYLGTLWEQMQPLVSLIGDVLVSGIQSAWEQVQITFDTLVASLNAIFDFLSAQFSLIVALWEGDFAGAAEAIKSAWNAVLDFFGGVANGIMDTFNNLVGFFGDVGTRMWEGLKAGFGKAVDGFKELGSSILDKVKGVFDINSPSRVMRDEVGMMLARGMADGITAGQRYVDTAVSKMIPTTSIDFAHSAIGKSSAASINASMLGQAQSGGNMTVNLVVDGKTLASVLLDPLKQTLRQKGEVLA